VLVDVLVLVDVEEDVVLEVDVDVLVVVVELVDVLVLVLLEVDEEVVVEVDRQGKRRVAWAVTATRHRTATRSRVIHQPAARAPRRPNWP